MKDRKQDIYKMALQARQQAYAPYSKYRIGAAVLTFDGKIFSGCNIENASYGGTVCAERVAIWKAVSELGFSRKTKIKEICVVSDSKKPWPPCGFCRQVMAEFCEAKTKIHIANLEGIHETYQFSELLPLAFTQDTLKGSIKEGP
jgi:cytidine deaminase